MKVGPFDQTWYCNERGYRIEEIKPYSAYDISDDTWAVKPVHDPSWGLDKFPEGGDNLVAEAEGYAAVIEAIAKMPEPFRTQQGKALWKHLHGDRSHAFSEEGGGFTDPGNALEKILVEWGLWDKLVEWQYGPQKTAGARGGLPEGIDYQHDLKGGIHVLTATHPDMPGDGFAGLISWWDNDGEIGSAQVHPEMQRRGLATELLRRAREITPHIHHSESLSEDAKAWISGMDGKTASWEQPVEHVLLDKLWPYREWNHAPGGHSYGRDGTGPYGGKHDAESWERHRQSVADEGIREPITVHYNPRQHAAYIGEGNHRLHWAKELGHTTVPVRVWRTGTEMHPRYRLPGEVPEREGHLPQTPRPSAVLPADWFPATARTASGGQNHYGLGMVDWQLTRDAHYDSGDDEYLENHYDAPGWIHDQIQEHGDQLRKSWNERFSDNERQGLRDNLPKFARKRLIIGTNTPHSIFNTGRMKTLHELHAEDDAPRTEDYITDRHAYEHHVMGVDHDVEPRLRPIYGSIHDHPGENDYGQYQLELKDHVRPRTTVTLGDSLNTALRPYGIEHLHQLNEHQLQSMSDLRNFHEMAERGKPSSYMEFQVHGGVSLDDIAKLHMHGPLIDHHHDLIAKAHAHGIEVVHYPHEEPYSNRSEPGSPPPMRAKAARKGTVLLDLGGGAYAHYRPGMGERDTLLVERGGQLSQHTWGSLIARSNGEVLAQVPGHRKTAAAGAEERARAYVGQQLDRTTQHWKSDYLLHPDQAPGWIHGSLSTRHRQVSDTWDNYRQSDETRYAQGVKKIGRRKMFIGISNLHGILDEGRMKSLKEVGAHTERDERYLKFRHEYEHHVMGIDPDLPAEERPIYGAMDDHPAHNPYGKYHLELKDQVRPRTTLTLGDSLNSVLRPYGLDDLHRLGPAHHQAMSCPEEMERVRQGRRLDYYPEFQVHGGVSVGDIHRLHVYGHLDDDDAHGVLRAMDHGIEVVHHAEKVPGAPHTVIPADLGATAARRPRTAERNPMHLDLGHGSYAEYRPGMSERDPITVVTPEGTRQTTLGALIAQSNGEILKQLPPEDDGGGSHGDDGGPGGLHAQGGLDGYFKTAADDDEDDYRMQHRPPEEDYGAPLHDLTAHDNGIYPDDIYTHPHHYDSGNEGFWDAVGVARKVRGKPEAMVRIYRALPAEHAHQGFRPGDWVSTSKAYARQHGRHHSDPKHDWPVISTRVPAKHLHTAGDGLEEYGYNGPHEDRPMVSFKGGYHQEVRVSDKDAVIRPVQRRAPKTARLADYFGEA